MEVNKEKWKSEGGKCPKCNTIIVVYLDKKSAGEGTHLPRFGFNYDSE